MRWHGVICLAFCLASLSTGTAQDVYVSHWGSHTPPFSDWNTAATNLIDAIHTASPGATVWVTNGIFRTGSASGGGLQSRVVITNAIAVRSLSGPAYTVIEGAFHSPSQPVGANAVRTVYMTNGILEGFTVRRGATRSSGTTPEISAGGLYAGGGLQANLRVSGNAGQTAGGAWLQTTTLSNVLFSVNTSITGPRVKINRLVRMTDVRLNNTTVHVPDIRIIGTNGIVIVNGERSPDSENGTLFSATIAISEMREHIFTVTNQGVRPLILSGATSLGPHASEFWIQETFPITIAPGNSAPLAMQFTPDQLGLREALMLIHNNDPDDDPYGIWVHGIGYSPQMHVLGQDDSEIPNGETETSIAVGTDFGLCIDEPIRRTFAITNSGTALLTLTNVPSITFAGAHPNDFRVTLDPELVIPPGTSTTFEIEFSPLAAEVRTAVVQLYSDDLYHSNGVYEFAVRGEVASTNLFFDIQANLLPVSASSMAWGDFNNNGRLDLAIMGTDGTNRFTDIYENLGDGNFAPIDAGITPLESGDLAWGDFNNNGWLDLAVMGRSDAQPNVTEIYRNNGDGSFTRIHNSSAGLYNGSLAWGDYDNDGDLDLIVTGYTLTANRVFIYRNNGDGTFTRLDKGMQGLRAGRIAWADLNNQGALDVLITGTDGSTRDVRIYRNNQGDFSRQTSLHPVPVAYGGLAFADFTRNGLLDLALTGSAGATNLIGRVYAHSGGSIPYNSSFTSIEPVWLGELVAADFNNNGWIDLASTGIDSNGVLRFDLYENESGTLVSLSTRIPGVRNASLAWGDFDGDGDLDLAISGLSSNGFYTAIHRNLAPTTNAPPAPPTGLSATLTKGNQVTFTWSPATDDHTPAQSLSYNLHVGTAENPIAYVSPQADLSTGLRRLPAMGNVQLNTEWTVKGLPEGDIVWGVQAIDGAYLGGEFAVGPPVSVPPLPDLTISDISITEVPFEATVTILNQGPIASTAPVILSTWSHRPVVAPCGTASQWTNTIGILDAGASTQVTFPLQRGSQVTTNVFRAFINSICDPTMYESRYDNNQLTITYTNRVYEEFWFQATALSGSVYLRWIDPVLIGMSSSDVLIRFSTSSFPSHPGDGQPLPGPVTGQEFHHTGLNQNQPYFYTIWLTHDGVTWITPPE